MNRFSQESFINVPKRDAIGLLLHFIGVDTQDEKQIELINKFFNVEKFIRVGSGAYANVFQINDREVLRISKSLPTPLPNDPLINQRSGFLKINGYYIEKFPLLSLDIDTTHLEHIREDLIKRHPEVWDLHSGNFGKDPETGKIKVLDPGCFDDVHHQNMVVNETKFMELQHEYNNLLDAVKDNPQNIQFIPKEYVTEEMALEAVKRDSELIKYIENQTEKIALEAVKQDGWAIRFVKNPTLEMYMTAIRKSPESLHFIKDQTYEICLEAVKQDNDIIRFVKDPQMKEKIIEELGLQKTSRFSKQFFTRFSSNKEAVKQLLTVVRANPEDQKLIDQVNKFFNVEMFEYLGSGLHANVYKINDNQVLRISGSLPMPLPKDKRINPRQGFLKINGFYIELFPLMDTTKLITNDEIERLEEGLKKDYPQVFDLHEENFGRDPQTGEPKVIDPGCFVPLDKENELYNENEFMRLQTEYKSLLDAIKADTLNIIHIPAEYQTEEMALYIAKHAPNRIGHIAKLSERAAIEAVKNDPWALLYMKDENKTYKVCLEAAKKGGAKVLTFRGVSLDVARRVREALGI